MWPCRGWVVVGLPGRPGVRERGGKPLRARPGLPTTWAEPAAEALASVASLTGMAARAVQAVTGKRVAA